MSYPEPFSRPYLRISGQISAVAITTRIVPTPPETTENTGPKRCATNPDSKPPSSFDVPMNRLFTAETRPRVSSGVSSCTSVCRTTTLTLSTAPQRKSIANENQNHLEKPKAIVASPNRSEEHTSELQLHSDLVCRLLLEKK